MYWVILQQQFSQRKRLSLLSSYGNITGIVLGTTMDTIRRRGHATTCEQKPKWAVELAGIAGKVHAVISINWFFHVADSISCQWLWFLLACWIDSALFSLYALGIRLLVIAQHECNMPNIALQQRKPQGHYVASCWTSITLLPIFGMLNEGACDNQPIPVVVQSKGMRLKRNNAAQKNAQKLIIFIFVCFVRAAPQLV